MIQIYDLYYYVNTYSFGTFAQLKVKSCKYAYNYSICPVP